MIREAGGSIRMDRNTNPEVLRRLTAAIADDKKRRWRDVGASPMDARLAAFSELYADADPDQRQILRNFFDGEQLRGLAHFVARAGRLLETTGDPRWLRRGVAAACIEGGRYDFRDLIASLSILRYGAQRAGIDIEPFFQEALEMSPPARPTEAPELQGVLLAVKSYPKRRLRYFVREFGPPEWRSEATSWWEWAAGGIVLLVLFALIGLARNCG